MDVTSISHMGKMRDSDWSRPNFLRSDWLLVIVATITTTAEISEKEIPFLDTTVFKGERFYEDVILDILTSVHILSRQRHFNTRISIPGTLRA